MSIRDVATRVQNDASESEIESTKSRDISDSTDVPSCRDSSVVESSVTRMQILIIIFHLRV